MSITRRGKGQLELEEAARLLGYDTFRRTARGHLLCRHHSGGVAVLAVRDVDAGGKRGWQNALATLRRVARGGGG